MVCSSADRAREISNAHNHGLSGRQFLCVVRLVPLFDFLLLRSACTFFPRACVNPGGNRRRPGANSRRIGISAQVAEWLMAADCKSAAPCELRRFESSPVHQVSESKFSSEASE